MPLSAEAAWGGAVFFIFLSLCIAAVLIRNNAAKKDSVGKSEKDSIANTVSIKPKKNTQKLD